MPASDELVALCRSQVALLTEVGAALSIVYLSEKFGSTHDKLVPITAYPEAAATWEPEQVLALLSRSLDAASRRLPGVDSIEPQPAVLDEEAIARQQMILPLVHDEIVMGLLVTARTDRPWSPQETVEIEQIAQTIAIASVMDQRAQWAEEDLAQQRQLQARQHEIFDDLLHQFRNPLTALRTFGKLLVRRLRPEDANSEVASGIVRESDRLQELLKQFDAAIDLGTADVLPETAPAQLPGQTAPALPSSLLTGTALKLEAHEIVTVLEPLLMSAGAIAQDRQLTLCVDLPLRVPPIVADLKALREVINNLLDNALKYTPAGGTISVRAGLQYTTQQGQMQGVAIADTGPGIPAADRSHLFERHYRGVQAEGEIPGTGLGLAIARDLIQQMQGDIQVFSPAHDSGLIDLLPPSDAPGTVFIVWLPEQPYSVAAIQMNKSQ
ncbi:sensor histidine kinase [Microcoleus sp. FACHB-1515]|nr:sensor histidine kinase [Microcoleus sp. FACHB-1515]